MECSFLRRSRRHNFYFCHKQSTMICIDRYGIEMYQRDSLQRYTKTKTKDGKLEK